MRPVRYWRTILLCISVSIATGSDRRDAEADTCPSMFNPFFSSVEASPVGSSAFKAASSGPSRIVAVGDLHGDLDNTLKVLQMMQVIDIHGHWKGGSTILVQTGDLVDRGPHSKDVMDLMIRLAREAILDNGRVVNLLGNHEVMNLQGDLRYVHDDDVARFGGKLRREQAFGQDGYYGNWLRSLDAVAMINDTLFVHAGLHPAFARWGLETINRKVKESLSVPPPMDEWHIMGMNGVVWTRMFDPRAGHPNLCGMLATTLSLMQANRMIVGHSVQESGFPSSLCDGRLILNDVGICKFYGGALAATEIIGSHVRFVSIPTERFEEDAFD